MRESGHPPASERFAWTCAVLGVLFVAGVNVDLWAHNNIRPLFETFFTPWHGLLYGGFAVMAVFLASSAALNRGAGRGLARALPRGYALSLLGVAIFAAGGVFDLAWHTAFGIEADFDAIISPSHLILVAGATLMVSAPIRAAAVGNNPSSWRVVISAFTTLTVLLPFFDFFVGPFGTRTATGPAGPRDALEPMEVLASLTYAGIVTGVFLYVLRSLDRPLPFGAGLLIVGGNAVVMAIVRTRDLGAEREVYFGVAVVAGLLVDLLLATARPSAGRPLATRLFAVALPVVILVPYFAAIVLSGPVTWTPHAIVGTIVLAGAVGGLLGLLATPPRVPSPPSEAAGPSRLNPIREHQRSG